MAFDELTFDLTAPEPWSHLKRQGLRFDSPLAEFGDREAFDFWWQQLQFVFDFDDPRLFAPLPDERDSGEGRTLARFVSKARELAASAALNHSGGVEITISDGGATETVAADLPAADAIAGFAVTFRQFYAEEPAGFKVVSGILMRHARAATDPHAASRVEQLKLWGRANGQLKHKSVERLALERLAASGRFPVLPPHELERYPDLEVPQQAIAACFYGEHLHWGERSALLDERARDPVDHNLHLLGFLKAAAGLSHLYLGYSLLVEAATRAAD